MRLHELKDALDQGTVTDRPQALELLRKEYCRLYDIWMDSDEYDQVGPGIVGNMLGTANGMLSGMYSISRLDNEEAHNAFDILGMLVISEFGRIEEAAEVLTED